MKHFNLFGRAWPIAPICLIFLASTLWPEMELLAPSLPAIKDFFNITDALVQNLLSFNFFGFFMGVLFAGPLCDNLGRKKTCVIGTLLFLIASLMACFSNDFYLLTFARFLQGITVTAPIIAGFAMLLDITKGVNQLFWISTSSACITLCMAIAPLIGSFINSEFGFKANLWAIFIAAFIGILPVIFWVPETLPKEHKKPLKFKAVFSDYFKLLKNWEFMGLSLVISSLPAAYWIYTGISALYMVDHLGMDAKLFGSYQGPIVATFAFFSITMNKFYKKYGLTICLLTGFMAMFLGTSALLILSVLGIESALMTTFFMMFFVGGMVPANSLLFPSALNKVPLNLQGSAQSIISALRLLLTTIGTSILGLFYSGPFLPIAILLFMIFFLGSLVLWFLRKDLSSSSEEPVIMSAH